MTVHRYSSESPFDACRLRQFVGPFAIREAAVWPSADDAPTRTPPPLAERDRTGASRGSHVHCKPIDR